MYGDGAKSLFYFGTNTGELCAELRNFMQCHIFVNCLTC
jgi:hypothetical protein